LSKYQNIFHVSDSDKYKLSSYYCLLKDQEIDIIKDNNEQTVKTTMLSYNIKDNQNCLVYMITSHVLWNYIQVLWRWLRIFSLHCRIYKIKGYNKYNKEKIDRLSEMINVEKRNLSDVIIMNEWLMINFLVV
jgi:hypothetical protein